MNTNQPATTTANAASDNQQFNIADWFEKDIVLKALAEHLERVLIAIVLSFPLLFVNPYVYLTIDTGCCIEHR